MKLISTKGGGKLYSLKDAVIRGLAPDGGLFMPNSISPFPSSFLQEIYSLNLQEICIAISSQIFGDELAPFTIEEIVNSAITFPAPLVKLEDDLSVLELFHGPSLAFKDFGAQFMAQLLSHFYRDDAKKDLVVLVATSGDTGGAVAAGFHNVPGVSVVILYPKGGVSRLQELQLTTFDNNIHAIELEGTFDDCQALVKNAFQDEALRRNIPLTSANSINIGRLIPQTFYYFEAYKQLENKDKPVVFSVPSGNFGNLTAGLIAKSLGLPISKFIASTNVNDVIPHYLNTNHFDPKPSIPTISNAMDVGNPSNFARMQYILQSSTWNIDVTSLMGSSHTDLDTIEQIAKTFETSNYILDPHGAVGVLGAEAFFEKFSGYQIISLATAHPTKFLETVNAAIKTPQKLHPRLSSLLSKKSQKVSLSNSLEELSLFLHDTF